MAVLEKSVQAIKNFINAYLAERDVEHTLACVSEDIYIIGAWQHGLVANKTCYRRVLSEEFAAVPDPIEYSLGRIESKLFSDNAAVIFVPLCVLQSSSRKPFSENNLRLTALVRENKGRYEICSLHYSQELSTERAESLFPVKFSGKTLFELQSELQVQTFHLLNNSIPGGMMGGYIEPGFPLYFVNDELLNLLGYTYDEFVKKIAGLVTNCIHPDDREYVDREVERQLRSKDGYEIRYRMLKKDNSFIWVLDRGKQVVAEDGRPAIISVCVDITESMLIQQKLERLAYIDPVTGGHNKSSFEKLSAELLQKNKWAHVLIYTNIDRFKLINDRFGKETADEILKQIHCIITSILEEGECSGRLAADNFGILLRYSTITELEQRLIEINRQTCLLSGPENVSYGIQMSYGVYLPEDPSLDIVTMLDRANLARKNSINYPRLSYGIYNESIKKQMLEEKLLEDRMHTALKRNEFVIYLQPKYALSNKSIAGAEALVRWQHPADGMLYPNSFIPVFERNGFIVQLDLYVFEKVCSMLRRWIHQGLRPVPVSVNLSKANLDVPNFLDAYKKVLKDYRIPGRYIEFEFTETLVYDNLETLTRLIDEIHALGCSCSMDDFGSGYSSLNLLKSILVDVLKIDRVFFEMSEAEEERSKNVIQGVISLAKSLNVKTVSEGIETVSQVEFLEEIGCDLVQGYVYAKPMPIQQFEELCFGSAILAREPETV